MTMTLLFAAAAALAYGGALDDAWICGRTDRNPLFYDVGDEVVFTLEARDVRGALPDGYTLKWTRTGDDGVRDEGTVPFTTAPFVYRTRIEKAGFVRLYAEVCGPDGKAYQKRKTFDLSNPEGREAANLFERQPKTLFFDGGAGAAIDTLQSLPEPGDFDAFWARRRKRLEDLPIIADLKPVVSNGNGVTYAVSVNCAGMMPATFHMSVPAKCASGTKVPAVVRFWGYSGNRKPAAFAPEANVISVDFNPHGFELGREDEYYREFYRATASGRATVDQSPEPVWPVGYGMDIDKNSQAEFAYFGGMTWRLMRCLQYVKTRPEWDGRNLKAVGGSQGGLQAIWAAALDPDVNEADSSITWCCDMGGETLGRNRGTWYVHWTKALGYYDPVNLAKRIPRTCAVTISRAGLGDYVCPPSGLAILWNNMRCPKRIVWVQGSQHGYVPPEKYEGCDFIREMPAEIPDVTESLQHGIDAAFSAGGGEVVVPRGDWTVKSVRLRSNVTLRLADGARLWASRDPRDYDGVLAHDTVEPVGDLSLRTYPGEDLSRRWENGIVKIFCATNVTILGGSASFIDGGNCADPEGEEGYRGPHGVNAAFVTNFTMRGVTLANTGNWATRFVHCANLAFEDVTVRGGHDGIHVRGSDGVRVTGCRLFTGDDSVAGYANTDVVVSNCVLNSACSPVRFGGRDVLITDCTVTGPAKYPHRWTLTAEEKSRGAAPEEVAGRRTTGCFFQPFSDRRIRPEMKPGNMVFRNLTITNPERFMVYLTGLAAIWQDGQGFDEIRFENVHVNGIGMPAAVVAPKEIPLRLVLKDCSFAFRTPQSCAFFGENVEFVAENVKVENVDGPVYEARQGVGFSDIPDFPSWRIETPETRRQWGL